MILLIVCSCLVQLSLQDTKLRVGFLLDSQYVGQLESFHQAITPLKIKYPLFEYNVELEDESNPYGGIEALCSLTRSGSSVIITATRCSTTYLIKGLAAEDMWWFPHLMLPGFSSCPLADEVESDSSLVIRPAFNRTVTMIQQIFLSTDTGDFVIFHDELFDYRYVLYLADQVKNELAKFGKRLKSLFVRLNHLEEPSISAVLGKIQGEAKFFKFIVLAAERNTDNLLKQAARIGLSGQQFLWVLANSDANLQKLRNFNQKFNLVAVIRSLPESMYGVLEPTKIKKKPEEEDDDAVQILSELRLKKVNSLGSWSYSHITNAAELAYLAMVNAKQRNPMIIFGQAQQLQCPDITSFNGQAQGGLWFGDPILRELRLIRDRYSLNNSIGITAFQDDPNDGVAIDSEGFKLETHLDLLMYRGAGRQHASFTNWTRISRWRASDSSWSAPTSGFGNLASSLEGKTLRIVTVIEEPFIGKKQVEGSDQYQYFGFCIDILDAIQEISKTEFGQSFQYQIYEVADGEYGVYDDEIHKWTGLIGDILLRKADMAVAGMIRNFEREQVVDFTAPYMDYGVGILIRQPTLVPSMFSFLEPLSIPIWALVALSAFVMSIVLFGLTHSSPYENPTEEFGFYFTYFNCVYWVMGALTQQGGETNPTSLSNRVLGTFFWYFSLVVVATYTANLAAFLTTGRMSNAIESLSDLANQESMPYGTVKDSSLEKYFKDQAENTDVELYKKLWSAMSGDPSPMVNTLEEGYSRVLTSDYAFMWDYPVLQYKMQQNCNYMMVGKPFNKKNYAFAVPKSVYYHSNISLAILMLQEQGTLDKLRTLWFENGTKCGGMSEDDSSAQGLTFDNIGGIFYILIGGCLVALVANFAENVWFKFMRVVPGPQDSESEVSDAETAHSHHHNHHRRNSKRHDKSHHRNDRNRHHHPRSSFDKHQPVFTQPRPAPDLNNARNCEVSLFSSTSA